MHVAFFFEYGEIDGIGTGHKYRSKAIAEKLQRKHSISFVSDVDENSDIFVVDHMNSQRDIILKAKATGKKVVLIDGDEEDAELVDVSVSAFLNKKAMYRGYEYVVFPTYFHASRYGSFGCEDKVFVGVGGFDKNNYAELAIKAVSKLDLSVIVAKSLNHPDFSEMYDNVEVFEEENYFNAMKRCMMAITNGGLTLFQALYYGMPCVPVAQYEHQKENIAYVSHFTLPVNPDEEDIRTKAKWLKDSKELRNDMSKLARHHIKGDGAKNICNLIEELM